MKASKSLLSIILIVFLIMSFTVIALAQDTEVVPIKVRCRAKPPMENWRGNNFLIVTQDLNTDLEAIGDPRHIKVEVIQDNLGWGEHVTEFVLGYGAGESPDIWLTGHEFIGAQSEAGRIIALDELMKEFPIFNLVFGTLWDCTMYKGEIWGVPQDAEARPLYWNKSLFMVEEQRVGHNKMILKTRLSQNIFYYCQFLALNLNYFKYFLYYTCI